jgi:hypothetical protein
MDRLIEAVTAALDAAPAPVTFFFRNDDAGWDDPALYRLLESLGAHGITTDLATIPAAVTADQAAQLGRYMRASGAARVHQHGYAHHNHESQGRKCEFGPARSVERRWADIRAGRDRLRDLFDGAVDPVFTPPWNRCDQDTLGILANEGFRILSRDVTAAPLALGSLQEVPVAIDWQKRTDRQGDAVQPLAQIAQLVADGAPLIGVMTHHATIDAAQLEQLGELGGTLASHPRVRFDTLGAMASRITPSSGVRT